MIKVLSLFDGISCARVALDKLHISCDYYASEIDQYAIQISQNNWSEIKHVGGVQTLNKFNFPHLFNKSVDLIIGGSPCQDLSIAKKDRKGLDGERSGLFWEYVRILKEVKPKYFILENVASMAKDQQDIITKELGVEPIMINAALLSAQTRKRLFWTNIPNVAQPEDRGILLRDVLQEKVGEEYYIKGNYKTWLEGKSGQKRIEKGFIKIDPEKAKGLMARDYANWSGNMVRVGQIGKGGQVDRIYSVNGKSVGLSALGGGRGAKTGLYVISSKQTHATISKDKSTPLVSAMGMGGGHTPMVTEDFIQIRKLTPIECERLQCLPDNYTVGVSDSQRYKALGNAFNVDVVAHILSFARWN